MATPEICRGLAQQMLLVFNQLLVKQHAGFKGVQVEHALTETVDGENGSLIHLPFCRQQQISRVAEIRDFCHQRG